MRPKPIRLRFPIRGLNVETPFAAPSADTTADAVNVRPYDVTSGRARGGRRGGLSSQSVDAGSSSPSGLATLVDDSGSTRQYSLVGLSSGTVVFPTVHLGKIYYGDGTGEYVHDGSSQSAYVAGVYGTGHAREGEDKGEVPSGFRIAATWRDRVVLSGAADQPQNWFMSSQCSPNDFDYAPAITLSSRAVAGNNTPAGLVGDAITGLVPYYDERMIFGGDRSIWEMRGDPAFGGSLVQVVDGIGMAFGRAWCLTPDRSLYFFGSRGGLFRYYPGGSLVRVSKGKIDPLLRGYDLGTNFPLLAYDVDLQAIRVLFTGLSEAWFYDERTDSFWKDDYGSGFSPTSLTVFDGDDPDDRAVVVGTTSGTWKFDDSSDEDAVDDVVGTVWIGPLSMGQPGAMRIEELIAVLGGASGDVDWSLHVGSSPDEAKEADASVSGSWSAGRNYSDRPSISGEYAFLKITNAAGDAAWSVEHVDAFVTSLAAGAARLLSSV